LQKKVGLKVPHGIAGGFLFVFFRISEASYLFFSFRISVKMVEAKATIS
jgi:hypothetical protein